MNVDDVLKIMSGYSLCNAFWHLAEGRYASAAGMLALAAITYWTSKK